MGSTGIPPCTSAVKGRGSSSLRIKTPTGQFSESGFWPLPLTPDKTSKFSPQPPIQIFKHILHFCQSEIIKPSTKDHFQAVDRVNETSPSSHPKESFHLSFKPFNRLFRDFQPRHFMTSHRVSEKRTVPWSVDPGFIPVHL